MARAGPILASMGKLEFQARGFVWHHGIDDHIGQWPDTAMSLGKRMLHVFETLSGFMKKIFQWFGL
jgi:hypothetical protein